MMMSLVAAAVIVQSSPVEVPPLVRSAFRSAYYAATLGSDRNVKLNDWVSLQAKRGTKLRASMDQTSATLTSDPGLHLAVKWAPDLRVKSVKFDFEKRKFDVDSEAAGWSVFGLVDWAGEKVLEWYLNKYVAPKVPQVGSLEAAGGMGYLLWKSILGEGPLADVDLRDVSLGAELQAPTDLSYKQGEVTVSVKAGTRLAIAVDTKGPLGSAKLASATAVVGGSGVTISGGSEPWSALLSARVRAVGIAGNGRVATDFDLGLDAASAMLEFATGTSIRRELEKAIQRDLPPGLYDAATKLARQNAGVSAETWVAGLLSGWKRGVASTLDAVAP
jgi:hypothetical protein